MDFYWESWRRSIVYLDCAELVLLVPSKLWSHRASEVYPVECECDVHVRDYAILVQVEYVIVDFHVD